MLSNTSYRQTKTSSVADIFASAEQYAMPKSSYADHTANIAFTSTRQPANEVLAQHPHALRNRKSDIFGLSDDFDAKATSPSKRYYYKNSTVFDSQPVAAEKNDAKRNYMASDIFFGTPSNAVSYSHPAVNEYAIAAEHVEPLKKEHAHAYVPSASDAPRRNTPSANKATEIPVLSASDYSNAVGRANHEEVEDVVHAESHPLYPAYQARQQSIISHESAAVPAEKASTMRFAYAEIPHHHSRSSVFDEAIPNPVRGVRRQYSQSQLSSDIFNQTATPQSAPSPARYAPSSFVAPEEQIWRPKSEYSKSASFGNIFGNNETVAAEASAVKKGRSFEERVELMTRAGGLSSSDLHQEKGRFRRGVGQRQAAGSQIWF